jgi:hypothetical protein
MVNALAARLWLMADLDARRGIDAFDAILRDRLWGSTMLHLPLTSDD